MTNTPDEDGIRYVLPAIIITAIAIAAFLIPSTPTHAPAIEEADPQSMFIHKVYAEELEPVVVQIATTSPEVIEPEPVPTLDPELQVICNCESAGYEHKDENGELLSGFIDSDDKGECQINTRYHGQTMIDMGLDIENDRDYYTYANYLFETQGKQPWMASAACWAPIIGYN